MRYGKKLALHRTAMNTNVANPANPDGGGGSMGAAAEGVVPYISHKYLKTSIERMVQQLKRGRDVAAQDREFFDQVDRDVEALKSHIHRKVGELQLCAKNLQQQGMQLGFLLTEETVVTVAAEINCDRKDIGRIVEFLSERAGASESMVRQLEGVSQLLNSTVSELNHLTDYVEINVAGFRKLLKQRAKQFASLGYDGVVPTRSVLRYYGLLTTEHIRLRDSLSTYSDAVDDFLERQIAQRRRSGSSRAVVSEDPEDAKHAGPESDLGGEAADLCEHQHDDSESSCAHVETEHHTGAATSGKRKSSGDLDLVSSLAKMRDTLVAVNSLGDECAACLVAKDRLWPILPSSGQSAVSASASCW
eukprot:g14762.t1